MSTKDKMGRWVVPEDQVDEFLYGRINYKKLIRNCMNSMKKNGNHAASENSTTRKGPVGGRRYRYR